MNRIVRVQDQCKHIGYVGRQALGHPLTVSDQRPSVLTMPGRPVTRCLGPPPGSQ